ncbi:MAG: glucuronate isomerase [Phycisphaerae bacterium]
MSDASALSPGDIAAVVRRTLAAQSIVDMHTHLYPPGFGTPLGGKGGVGDPDGLLLWGVDELVTYHYLVAELFRVTPPGRPGYEEFWRMNKCDQADLIWRELFVDRTPLSEACRGVLQTLKSLGLDPNEKSLARYRKYFAEQTPSGYIDKVMTLANVSTITMTNAVFDDNERTRWLRDGHKLADARFTAVLRIDPLVRDYAAAAQKLAQWGYAVGPQISDGGMDEIKRFLTDWLGRQRAVYVAMSLPPEFKYPAGPGTGENEAAGLEVLRRAILPVCADMGLPFAMMIGSRLRVNPALRDAGDMVGKADIASVVNLCRQFDKNKFFVTMLARENQHELAVAARKFGNLMVFGCWWFLNNPSLIAEITQMRLELLGSSFIPQHSDARVLDQLIYKWAHSREVIGRVLADKYEALAATGRSITEADIAQDAHRLFAKNYLDFLAR